MLRKSPPHTAYACRDCGQTSPRWEGRCPGCGAWNTVEERLVEPRGKSMATRATRVRAVPRELSAISSAPVSRLASGVTEIDRVFGGGIVPGSISLIAGDPGIGKSTLLLQLSESIARAGRRVLYVSGEESSEQIKLRAGRLEISGRNLFLLATGQLEAVIGEIESQAPSVVVVDSIQTMSTAELENVAGSSTQVQACTHLLTELAKMRGIPVVMTGHVTKDGSIAGPKLLEHAVDVVLYLEGDQGSGLRLLRGVKNRFGPTDEVGVFEMRADGLSEVADPSRAFLDSRSVGAPGSALATVIEGTRPFTFEVQALTAPSSLPAPRRLATGLDPSRLALVTAVLSRRLGLALSTQDVIVNVPGGLRVREPAIDLAVALAIASSLREVPVRDGVTAAAEVGLGGELRPVGQIGRRASEAARLGITTCLVAAGAGLQSGNAGVSTNAGQAGAFPSGAGVAAADASAVPVRTLSDAIEFALPRR